MIDVPVRVKDALRDGRLKKNYRFVVLNSDGSTDFTIDNNTLVSESVKFDERMCSGDTIKFGLCEGSSLEFQYFDHPNINGRRLNSFIDVEYKDPSMEIIETEEGTWHPVRVTKNGAYTFKSKNNVTCEIGISTGSTNRYYRLNSNNSYQVTLDLTTANSFWVDTYNVAVVVTTNSGFDAWHTIPMGYFTVDKCPRQASTGIFKVTAYNKLKAEYLDQKANDQIIEIVGEGMSGSSDGVDIAVILDKLLGEYAIKRPEIDVAYTYTGQNTTSTQNARFNLCNVLGESRGLYMHIYSTTFYVEPSAYYSDNVYRVVMNCKNIYDSIVPDLVDEYERFWDDTFQDLSTTPHAIHTLNEWLNGTVTNAIGMTCQMWSTNGQHLETHINGANRTKNNVASGWFVDLRSQGLIISIPTYFILSTASSHTWTAAEVAEAVSRATNILFGDDNNFRVELSTRTSIEKLRITTAQAEALPDVTLRQLQAATYEINCQYGQIDRETDLFDGVELNNSKLLPRDNLYPANSLYPGGQASRGDSSAYSKLWTDNQGTQNFRYLIITYKGLDANNQAKDMTLQRTVNANGNTDYNMSDNWLFKNLVWSASDVGDYADAMVSKMQDVSWFPFEMWGAGLPYLETGDEIEITNDEGTYTSYILQRQLQGVQNLQDTFINGTLDVF